MAVDVKICGLSSHETVEVAVGAGARYIGFVFYPPSPRAVTPNQAIELGKFVPAECQKVGVLVNPDDSLLEQVAPAVDAVQLHGKETPERIKAIKAATGKLIIIGLSVADASDFAPLAAYADIADMILFDAKPPKVKGSLPGGNGLSFDWRLLEGLELPYPWMLSGGLNSSNLADAVKLCRADAVDVSSGVEAKPGIKDKSKILDFLNLAATLQPDAPTT